MCLSSVLILTQSLLLCLLTRYFCCFPFSTTPPTVIVNLLSSICSTFAVSGASIAPKSNFELLVDQFFPEPEYSALFDLYHATAGELWKWTGNQWIFSPDANPCVEEWQGIECTIVGNIYHVDGLNLNEVGLVGHVPESIGNLTYLLSLDLNDNQLRESLPNSMYTLVKLETLRLGKNSFTGHILEDIGNLGQLVTLDLSRNKFAGPIPAALYSLTRLQSLDLFRNSFSGTISDSIGSLTQLLVLNVGSNQLIGTIPSAIGSLTSLVRLDLGLNYYHPGHMPESFSQLQSLQWLAMDSTYLTGPIPSFIGTFPDLTILTLVTNALTGPLPSFLCKLTALTVLDINSNLLVGSIPECISNFTLLQDLNLHRNQLTGSIPDVFNSMKGLFFLSLEDNKLDGPIPHSVCNLTMLYSLIANHNELSGHIPDCFDQLTLLEVMTLDRNRLSGSIPVNIGEANQLTVMTLHDNLLTGEIPVSFGKLAKVIVVDLADNGLSGSLPRNIGQASALEVFIVDNNFFTGTLPSTLGNLSQLVVLYTNNNSFTGHIPESFCNLTEIEELYMPSNYLSGAIPDCFGDLQYLFSLDFDFNHLTGPIQCVGRVQALNSLSLRGNHLTGPLTNAFSVSQRALISILLDGNQFTGELPSVLFQLSNLNALSIVGSCLHGTLPTTVCNATALESLILYGLTTGQSCRSAGVSALSVHRKQSFGGTFPTCLLSMPNLITLLLSSNGLTGKIETNATLVRRFIELDLSHNSLTGSIPSNIQNHTWFLLDLSHNKLDGVLHTDIYHLWHNLTRYITRTLSPAEKSLRNITIPQSDPVYSLSTNRLSGLIPHSLLVPHNITIVAGNLFQCRYDKSNLPQNDGDLDSYSCASNAFDVAFYVWLGLTMIVVLILACVYYYRTELYSRFIQSQAFLPVELSTRLTDLYATYDTYNVISKAGWYGSLFCVVILVPYYAIISHYKGTHTHQYAYIVSAIYTNGAVAFALDVALLTILLITTAVVLKSAAGKSDVKGKENTDRSHRVLIWCVFSFVNVAVVLGVNIAFVYVVLNESSQAQTAAQIALSLFKLSWSMVASPYMIRRLRSFFQPGDRAQSFFELQLLVALFNNIAIPCLVTAAISPNCFVDVLAPPASETVNYLLSDCVLINALTASCEKTILAPVSLQFTPPFIYSYQCSASFITSYAPAFVYMSISTVVLTPLMRGGLLQLYRRLKEGTIGHQFVCYLLPRMLQPPSIDVPSLQEAAERPLVGAVGTLVTLFTQLGILLTFGAIFPPVALAMAVSITAVVYLTRYRVLNFIRAAVDAQLLGYLDVINAECAGVGTVVQMQLAVKILVCYCCAFYTLFLFDTLGDAQGFDSALWVLFVVPLAPLAIFAAMNMHNFSMNKNDLPNAQEVELSEKSTVDVDHNITTLQTISVLHEGQV